MNTSQDGFGSYLIYFPNPNNLTSKGGVGFLKTKSTSYIERLRDLRNYEPKVVAVCLIHSSNLKFQIPIVLFYVRLNSTSRPFQIPILQDTRNL